METLEHELKAVIARRLNAAGPREVLTIASALCSGEAPAPVVAVPEGPRFRVDGDTVLDRTTGLMWSRENVPGGTMKWAAAKEACSKLTLGGHSAWRLPTIRELLTLVDYDRRDPAIDTEAFKCDAAYYWTSTPVAFSPGVFAWLVHFSSGFVSWYYQDFYSHVRAVRASQSFALWHVK